MKSLELLAKDPPSRFRLILLMRMPILGPKVSESFSVATGMYSNRSNPLTAATLAKKWLFFLPGTKMGLRLGLGCNDRRELVHQSYLIFQSKIGSLKLSAPPNASLSSHPSASQPCWFTLYKNSPPGPSEHGLLY